MRAAASRVRLLELPPRTRRIHTCCSCSSAESGTTSAHAENTCTPAFGNPSTWNYLRARGEYSPALCRRLRRLELPPRTRRIQSSTSCTPPKIGTTSAHAENTFTLVSIKVCSGNYLRARGEYPNPAAQTVPCKELPPRTRRILNSGNNHDIVVGTTSAHAENTFITGMEAVHARNYLRARGEYLDGMDSGFDGLELPPRTRRIHRANPLQTKQGGTTSAHAENTAKGR